MSYSLSRRTEDVLLRLSQQSLSPPRAARISALSLRLRLQCATVAQQPPWQHLPFQMHELLSVVIYCCCYRCCLRYSCSLPLLSLSAAAATARRNVTFATFLLGLSLQHHWRRLFVHRHQLDRLLGERIAFVIVVVVVIIIVVVDKREDVAIGDTLCCSLSRCGAGCIGSAA
jgi:hypothetical protein